MPARQLNDTPGIGQLTGGRCFELEAVFPPESCRTECPVCPGGLNGWTQHFIFEGKDGVEL